MASVWAWMPDAAALWEDLTFVPDYESSSSCEWQGMPMQFCENTAFNLWVGNWPRTLAQNWHIPLSAVVAYAVGIVALRRLVASRGKVDVKTFAFYWNLALAIFSVVGLVCCARVLVHTLRVNGLYFATCARADWYGVGASGVFIFLFVLSKFIELIDTALLLLSGKPVIFLHWWHHSSVLLYCWHSYTTRISTGLWFATCNYCAHCLMYGFFALTQTSYRKRVFPYAPLITLFQLVQMLVGMWITMKAVTHQMAGEVCHVNRTNSVLGMCMYLSFFILYGKLYIDKYLLKKRVSGACTKDAKEQQEQFILHCAPKADPVQSTAEKETQPRRTKSAVSASTAADSGSDSSPDSSNLANAHAAVPVMGSKKWD